MLPLLAAGAAPRDSPRPVRVQTVALVPVGATLTVSGTVQARLQADLSFRVTGKVVSRPIEIGDPVHAGQVLAQLDPADLQLSQEAAEAALQAAEADAENAHSDLARYQRLGRRSPAYVPSEYDKRVASERAARARLAQALRQLAIARDQRLYGALVADADGIVTALPVQVGQVVSSGQTVATVAHTGEIEVVADVPENRLAEVRAARDVRVSLWALPGTTLQGTVREIGALADPASRTFTVKVTLRDVPPGLVALGMTASVEFAVARPEVAVLPATALADLGGRPAVWVLDGATGRASLHPVQLSGFGNDGSLLIRGGLAAGEQVITAGVHEIAPDMSLVAWAGASR